MSRALLYLFCLLPTLAVAAPQVSVRSALLGGDNALVGGTVTLQLDVLVDTWFSSPPELPTLSIDGTVVTPPSGEALHLTEKSNGKTLFGLRFNYLITPLNAQAYDIPALSIRVHPGESEQPVSVNSTPAHFSATQPAGAKAGESALIAQQVELTQMIVKSHDPLRVGDSITRKVQTRAIGAQAMLIPAPTFEPIKGLTAYVQPPSVHPLTDGRGGTNGGAREDSVMYRITQNGHFSLPAIEMQWWSTPDGQAHSASAPAISVEASGEASYQTPFSMAEDLRALRHNAQVNIARHWLLVLAVLIVAAVLVYLGRAPARRLWIFQQQLREQRKRAWLNCADYAWQLARQQLTGQPLRLDGLYLWVRRSSGHVDLRSFLNSRDVALMRRFQQCLASLYTPMRSGAVQAPAALLDGLQHAHRRHAARHVPKHALKPLNPPASRETYEEIDRHATVA